MFTEESFYSRYANLTSLSAVTRGWEPRELRLTLNTMDNTASGEREAKTTSLPAQGTTTLEKQRADEADGRAADKAGYANSGVEAVRVVAAEEAGAGVATVGAEHRALEARC